MITKRYTRGISILIVLGFTFFSCVTKTREERVSGYLKEKGVSENAFAGILNPDYCGSCTDYSIKWLERKKVLPNQEKIILITGELKPDYKARLKKAGYHFVSVDQDKLGRMGITLTACTSVIVEQGEVVSIEIVK